MKYRVFLTCLLSFFMLSFSESAFAVENPLSLPNNKIGIHILFDNELPGAAKLINANGGEWGYVTIPIQIGDRDLEKWQNFMNQAQEHKVIPLVRLASEGDPFNKKVWKKPTYEDIVDLANFLDSLYWPTKNRYIIVFNETNRGDEWGGTVDPKEYAQMLSFAVSVFKSKNPDYFMISSGMDNAAPNQYPEYMDQYAYYRAMQEAVPGIFNQIDGFSSHSYPNPGFSQPPTTNTTKSIYSFQHEMSLIRSYRNSDIPVFITETGWNAPSISDEKKAEYYRTALETVWNDPSIVAITPFLFRAGGGPFAGFSFIGTNGEETKQYEFFKNIPKIKGNPTRPAFVGGVLGVFKPVPESFPEKDFSNVIINDSPVSISDTAQTAFKWIMKL